jgi:hypothetical protein
VVQDWPRVDLRKARVTGGRGREEEGKEVGTLVSVQSEGNSERKGTEMDEIE